jgi:sialic acid synthase SpsE/mannose-6-phosphate isomerase-like protein (cupin superfamily)
MSTTGSIRTATGARETTALVPPAAPPLLFVFEMANNHMGSVEHGLRIIRELREASQGFDFALAVKFQYRELDTLIHPDYRSRTDLKYVKRFTETRLSASDYLRLRKATRDAGFLAVCTAFDEASVGLVEAHDYDAIKIASCSFTDWPLLERVAATSLPVIASCAGAALEDVDRVVSFFEHRQRPFTLMHCVGEYPTPLERLELGQIELFRDRYPNVRVGFSTHEAPDTLASIPVAIAKGATVFEKHVGVPTKEWPLNAYSANPAQVRAWLAAARDTVSMSGTHGQRAPLRESEAKSLFELRRGVYARRAIARGERLKPEDLMLAMPTQAGQVTANDLSKYTQFTALRDIPARAAVLARDTSRVDNREKVNEIVRRVRELLHESRVAVPAKTDFEISYHYGIERFDEFGATILTCINREYCKKLIVLLPGQTHPEQFHKKKEETFLLLYGSMTLGLDGKERELAAGDIVTVERGQKHWFKSTAGCVVEEISSTHYTDDSFYTDPAIGGTKDRKTWLTHWLA